MTDASITIRQSPVIDKAQRTAETLRKCANRRSAALSGSNTFVVRDAQAEALADLAELMLAVIIRLDSGQ